MKKTKDRTRAERLARFKAAKIAKGLMRKEYWVTENQHNQIKQMLENKDD